MDKRTNLKAWLIISLFLVGMAFPVTTGFADAVETLDKTDGGISVDRDFGKMPLYFIENQGQLDTEVDFYVQGSDKTLYFTPQGVTFALAGKKEKAKSEETQRWVVKLDFVGANPDVRPRGEDRQEAVISYFKGQGEDWKAGLPTYGRIVYPELWDGIDLVYSGSVNKLKYEFVVKPGADTKQIRLAYRGAGNVTLKETGELMVETPMGRFADAAPYAYQEIDGQREAVSMAYTLKTKSSEDSFEYVFDIGPYDTKRPLILDPVVLVYCGYIGGDDWDGGNGIAVDDANNAYVTGYTRSGEPNFPAVVGPDLGYNWGTDAFVAKVKADGTGLLYCGYIGGTNDEYGNGIVVDDANNAYVVGWTESTQANGFPVTVGPDLTHNGGTYFGDAFVAKVKADGTGLLYCGYIGGTNDEYGNGIAVDDANNAYVVGWTESTQANGFPVVVGPDLTHNGGRDVFVAKVKAVPTESANPLVYCGYIGGTGEDEGHGIAVDNANYAYVTGYAMSSQASFPVVVGPDLTHNGGCDAFVAKVKANPNQGPGPAFTPGLIYCGYIGGNVWDNGFGIAVDDANNAYVTGGTGSSEATFPVVIGPDLTYNDIVSSSTDAFVAKVKADPNQGPGPAFTPGLIYCGYIGGGSSDEGRGIALDDFGNAYVTGYTWSSEATFPEFIGPILTYSGGMCDAFVSQVNAAGTGLAYCGYIGGLYWDYGNGIAVDAYSNAYVAGQTYNNQATFPVVVGPDLKFNGKDKSDAFVAKISHGQIYYVDDDAENDPEPNDPDVSDPCEDGSIWHPFDGIQEAIDVTADGDAVVILDGTYTGIGNWDIDFEGRGIIVSSSNPDDPCVVVETLIDCQGDPFNLRRGFKFHSSEDGNSVLAGLTIMNGYAPFDSTEPCAIDEPFGGGIYFENSKPQIRNCTFANNYADSLGGAMFFGYNSDPVISNCIFSENSAENDGGAMFFGSNGSSTVTHCKFVNNITGAGGGGGAIANSGGNVEMFDCQLRANIGADNGGGIWNSGYLKVVNGSFFDNLVENYGGGGIFNYIGGQTELYNCLFVGNQSVQSGGAIYSHSGEILLSNCTLSQNQAQDNGGGVYNYSGESNIFNCIFWSNTASGDGNEIALYNESTLNISYSDIKGDVDDIYDDGSGNTIIGIDNINTDPCFTDPNGPDGVIGTEDDNLRLMADSPCIDAGNNDAVPEDANDLDNDGNTIEPIPWDLDSRDRIVDGYCSDTNVVDMGAYEFTSAYYGDFDGDCDVEFIDYSILANFYLTDEFSVDIAPTPAGDGIVDANDLAVLCNNWLLGVE
jgi:predicted outer membrane repeat protein